MQQQGLNNADANMIASRMITLVIMTVHCMHVTFVQILEKNMLMHVHSSH